MREALRAGRHLDHIVVARGAGGSRLDEIIALAREARVPIRFEPRERLDRMSPGVPHQGVVARGAGAPSAEIGRAHV